MFVMEKSKWHSVWIEINKNTSNFQNLYISTVNVHHHSSVDMYRVTDDLVSLSVNRN